MISQKQINGEPFVVVETPRWKAEIILSVGSNMLSLIDRNTGLNILREPPSMEALKKQPEIYGLPVLIPPNCIYQGKFSWRGRDYSLPVNNRFGSSLLQKAESARIPQHGHRERYDPLSHSRKTAKTTLQAG